MRILLPPPLGFTLSLALELTAEPQTPPLQILINRAAELAIPGAGPILTETLRQIPPAEILGLLTAGETAATDSLRQRSYQLVVHAIEARVASEVADNGALRQYQELKQAYDASQPSPVPPLPALLDHPVTSLEDYVTTAAVDGLFRLLGEEEKSLRSQLSSLDDCLPELTLPPTAMTFRRQNKLALILHIRAN